MDLRSKVDENQGGGGFACAFPVRSKGRRNRLLHPSTVCELELSTVQQV